MPLVEAPAESGERLDALRDAWNQLRNEVVGRNGMPPPQGGSATDAFVSDLNTVYASWRDWYEEVSTDAIAAIFGGYDEELSGWQQVYDDFYVRARKLGLTGAAPDPRTLPQAPGVPIAVTVPATVPDVEVQTPAIQRLGSIIGWSVAALVFAGVALVLVKRR